MTTLSATSARSGASSASGAAPPATAAPAPLSARQRRPPAADCESTFQSQSGAKRRFPQLKDAPTLDLSVIVPAYNEDERIAVMLDEALEYLFRKDARLSAEIVVVDDGSRDDTDLVVLGYVQRFGDDKIRLLRLAQNQGKGGAVRMGMLHARGRLLLMADADRAVPIADVEKLLLKLPRRGGRGHVMAVVVGSRRESEKETGRSFLRRFLSYGFSWYTRFVGGVRGLEDTQCGFKLFTRDAARAAFPRMRLRRWAFDIESLYLAQQAGATLTSQPVHWTEIPGSKLSVVKATLNMARDILLMRFNYVTGRWK